MKNVELLHQAIQAAGSEQVERLIKRFILSNDLQIKTKFNLFDYVSTNKLRLSLSGVYYSKGFQYATDANILIKIKAEYSPDFEGKIIDKKANEIAESYPLCDAVIPEDKNLNYAPVDWDRVLQIGKEYAADKRIKKDLQMGYVEIGGVVFSVILLVKIAKFAKYIGTKEIGLNTPDRAAKVGKGAENVGVLMPVVFREGEVINRKEYTL